MCDCYLRVDNQTSGHDVISDGAMRPTLYLQSSRFPVDQLLLFALIPWIPFLFSSHLSPPILYFPTFSPFSNRVFHLSSLTLNCLPLFLSNSLLSLTLFLLYLLLLLLSITSHSPWVRRWGRRLMMVEKLWHCLIFYYQNWTASDRLYFLFGCGGDGSWDCSVITELNVYSISYPKTLSA